MGSHAHFCKVSWRADIETMEDMLIVWLQDLMHERFPLGASAIRHQALNPYGYLKGKSGSSVDETFNARFAQYRFRWRISSG